MGDWRFCFVFLGGGGKEKEKKKREQELGKNRGIGFCLGDFTVFKDFSLLKKEGELVFFVRNTLCTCVAYCPSHLLMTCTGCGGFLCRSKLTITRISSWSENQCLDWMKNHSLVAQKVICYKKNQVKVNDFCISQGILHKSA